jgi:hypothetical protein
MVSNRIVSPIKGDELREIFFGEDTVVSNRIVSPIKGDSPILNPYPARSPEALSEAQLF